ncbi:aliphatic sulfonate ABC transporter substrate-binding protein [Pseudomonadota bacterium]|nr:aliphatic sulfonate ABC transporter substrate-binding protein [Pseudomonadota bacterium]
MIFRKTKKFFSTFIGTIIASTTISLISSQSYAEIPKIINIDYAYYNPVSLLMKDRGSLEKAFKKDNIKIRWVLSLGSNKALEYLNGGSIDFGSTAGASAVIGRANGIPIKAIYVYSKPEWTALVTNKNSGITGIKDLVGKRVAVTRGTDPHIFLLQALDSVGLTEKDIKPVLLQHPDGYRALVSGQVDAWAGLDPHMAKGELETQTPLFYRNADLNTYGILNVREEFSTKYPLLVKKVLKIYEENRLHAIKNPNELKQSLIKAVKLSGAVAQKQLNERTDITNPNIGPKQINTFLTAGNILQKIGIIKASVSIKDVINELVDTSFLSKN